MQKYTLMPGKMIQTCRKVPDFIHQKLITSGSVKYCQELISKLNEQNIIEVDRSGCILILFEFLKSCISYYWVYNQNYLPSRNQSPAPRRNEKKSLNIDEELEISREYSKNSSNKSISPERSKPKISEYKNKPLEVNTANQYGQKNNAQSKKTSESVASFEPGLNESKIIEEYNEDLYEFQLSESKSIESYNFVNTEPKQSEVKSKPVDSFNFLHSESKPNELKNNLTQNNGMSKSDSTKSFNLKENFEMALEEKFKDFLRKKFEQGSSNIFERIHLLDLFEREIRDEIREKFLQRVIDEKSFNEEIQKANNNS